MSKEQKPLGRAHWAKVVKKWKASGKSGCAYADRHGMAVATLYSWNRELKNVASAPVRRKWTRSTGERAIFLDEGASRVACGASYYGNAICSAL